MNAIRIVEATDSVLRPPAVRARRRWAFLQGEILLEALTVELAPHLPHGLRMSFSGVEVVEVRAIGVDKAKGLRHPV